MYNVSFYDILYFEMDKLGYNKTGDYIEKGKFICFKTYWRGNKISIKCFIEKSHMVNIICIECSTISNYLLSYIKHKIERALIKSSIIFTNVNNFY